MAKSVLVNFGGGVLVSEDQDIPRIHQMVPAAGWFIEDRNGDRRRVVAFALYSYREDDDTVIRAVEPLIAFDDVIELPSYPYTLRHEMELVQ